MKWLEMTRNDTFWPETTLSKHNENW
jgi:hypothetical protein